jgi:hypothetical protein
LIGTVQAWEAETTYPDETPFVSDLGSVSSRTSLTGPGWLGLALANRTPIEKPLAVDALGEQLGRVWIPWGFTPRSHHRVVSSVGMGAIASGTVLAMGGSGLGGTTVLPASGVLALMNPGQITAETTPLWEDAGEIRLLTPGLLPRRLRVRETLDLLTGAVFATTDSPVAEALGAIADVGRWLSRSPSDVAELCGFSIRTFRYWGSGKTNPRPSTVRHLHEVHVFLGSLVESVGRQRARDWLTRPSDIGGDLRLDLLGEEQGIKALLREANSLIFAETPKPERPLPEATLAREAHGLADPYVPSPKRPPRRPRRPSPA